MIFSDFHFSFALEQIELLNWKSWKSLRAKAKMSRFESVMISRARTVKIEDLEKELDEEVKELNNVDQDRALDIDNAKLSRAKRERDLAKLIQTKEHGIPAHCTVRW